MDRKELIRKYKETPRPAGVFRVRHASSGRTLLGSSVDAPVMLNRIRAQLNMHSHPNREFQADWDAGGSDAFDLEVLDLLTPSEDPSGDAAGELRTLEELWREKLDLGGDSNY